MGFISKLFKRHSRKNGDNSKKDQPNVTSNKHVQLANELVVEVNELLKSAVNSTNNEYQSIQILHAKNKIKLLEIISQLHPYIMLTTLEQVERDIKSLESKIYKSREKELKILAMSLGKITAHCPSCAYELAKFPKRKIKCKSCGSNIYPKKHPLNQEFVLISDSEYPLFDELSYMKIGEWDSWHYKQIELSDARNELAKNWGVEDASKIPEGDAMWSIINSKALDAMRIGDWYGYKDLREEGIRQLLSEGKKKNALPLVFEYIYLSYNVVMPALMEIGGEGYVDELKMYSPQVFMINSVISDINELSIEYTEFMSKSSLPHLFKGTIQRSLDKYIEEKKDCC